ncbi:uncharacterized protein LOC116342660 [Contarinia nasturtii]|uniref:uncharacterized protein LOC116342660 n=1 Tax=Contarinia nasturtii TaxID=265458 RepID=UPI0012D38426|nr:uncharacterized protein LOC116342660 [Contarinia nasturtii]
MDSYVPRITVQSGTDPPWYTKQLKHMKNVRRKAYKQARQTSNFDEYNKITDSFIQLQSQLFKSYISRIQSQIKSNPKHFWRFVNDRRKRSDIPAIVEYNDVTANTDTSKAELFADFFENQYTRSDIIDLDELLDECGDVSFDFEITEADVLNALQFIDANKGAGPDGISTKVLKNCAHSLSKPLTALFRKSLQQGCVPDALKKSRIVPIYKAGKKSNAVNYRPVVIIPTIAKLFEIVVYDKIDTFINGKSATINMDS